MKTFWEVVSVIICAIAAVVAFVAAILLMIAAVGVVWLAVYGTFGFLLSLAWNEIALQYVDAKPVVWYHVSIALWCISIISKFIRGQVNVKITRPDSDPLERIVSRKR